jgi:addiction module RelE/StbE family toxin
MKIHWTESAVENLKGIKEYIAKDSEYYAINFSDRIISSVEQLLILPEMGRKVPEADENSIREIIVRPYRIIYQLQENSINIVTIIHSARELASTKLKKWETG